VTVNVRAACLAVAIAVLLSAAAVGLAAGADTGWTIQRFAADIAIQADGSLRVDESIDVDFGTLQRHGIFRNVPIRYEYDATRERVYDLSVRGVTDANGRNLTYERTNEGPYAVIKIGDADRTLTGAQTYRISYDVRGALNAFGDHDELFWNATGGDWSVPIRAASATVIVKGGVTAVACFEGPTGSQAPCRSTSTPARAEYAATRAFAPGEQLTIVTALAKGTVPVPAPKLEHKARDVLEWFELSPLAVMSAVFVFIMGLTLVLWRWLTAGRDVQERETIVPEYEPPDRLRPAQIGLVVDESADTKDVTATIVDLGVRGYLTIAEVGSPGLFAKKDWNLTKTAKAPDDLLPYERIVYDGLFDGRDGVLLSELRTHFSTELRGAEAALYRDSVAHGWFARRPDFIRNMYGLIGFGMFVLGLVVAWLLGTSFGLGLVGVAIAALGLLVMPVARVMPAKTAAGAELLRRALGFRRYMEVAETDRARFAEKENIFSEYLPYAIVFGVVEKWARAFAGIDTAAQTATWYVGGSPFSSSALSENLQGFSGSLGSAIAATPGSSGGSGFSGGGGSGGGGGGGGGGSW